MSVAAKPIYCGPSLTELTRAYYVFSPHLRNIFYATYRKIKSRPQNRFFRFPAFT